MVYILLLAKQKWRHRHREQTYRYQAGKCAGHGMNWEVGMDIYILLRMN